MPKVHVSIETWQLPATEIPGVAVTLYVVDPPPLRDGAVQTITNPEILFVTLVIVGADGTSGLTFICTGETAGAGS